MKEINKTRWIILGVFIFLLVSFLAAFPTINNYYVKSKLEPQLVLEDSIKNMSVVNSYRYSLKSGFSVDGREEVISEVQGEKNGENTHIKGEMVNTPIDIYYIDRTIYNYDSFAEKWLIIESGTTNSEELLISELNPLSNFRFKQINSVEKLRFEYIDGAECLVVMCKPSIEIELLETLWKDFEYHIWLDYKDNLIKRALLTATNKQNEKTELSLETEFMDINKKISIKSPIEE
ncbi:MAG TPA: hypothetical protein VFC73_09155 [Syntrophomonadaceae bacterium]|nr:hypothetical protein [Syntrophomonadaceae bacterium]